MKVVAFTSMEANLPFKVSRSSRRTLVEQVVDGLRQCIVSGRYRKGDILPTTRELAERLGVSRIVTRAAVRALSEAGLINPRPGVGCVVLGTGGRLWNGRVLFISRTDGRTYYVNVFTATLRALLVKAGWLFTQATVEEGASSRPDVSELEVQLTHPVDLAVVMFDNAAAERVLAKSDTPYILLGEGKFKSNASRVACIGFDRAKAAPDALRACLARGIRRVVQIGIEPLDDISEVFRAGGLDVDSAILPMPSCGLMPHPVARAARDYFDAVLADESRTLPDLFYFSDDHVCRGALASLRGHGLRIPDDVSVLTWANRGNEPIFEKDLARLELDPEANAQVFANQILDYLRTGRFGAALTFGTAYAPGETL